MNKQTKCKSCGEEINSKAAVCPKCGVKNKKPIYKRVWFIILVAIVVIAIFTSIGGNDSHTVTSPTTENTPTKEIVYTEYSVSQLVKDLESNALKAETTYQDQYVKLTGKVSTIDSDGQYISLSPTDGSITFTTVQCFVQNEEQKNYIINISTDDTIIVKGKITDVGELLGYQLDIDSFE